MINDVVLDASSLANDTSKCSVSNLRPLDENASEDWQRALENARLDNLLQRMDKAATMPSHALARYDVPTRQSSHAESYKVGDQRHDTPWCTPVIIACASPNM